GTDHIAVSVPVDTGNIDSLIEQILRIAPDLVLVGPEAPLVLGVANRLDALGVACFGPTSAAAQIESSKSFSKRLMRACEIPTADFEVFSDFERLRSYVHNHPSPADWVVKADGLAAGKGVYVCTSEADVLQRAHDLIVERLHGAAGATVVIERRLRGREVSALYWCDGEHFAPLPGAQDYKRAEDGDAGPNTGGMGSYCPASHLTTDLQHTISRHVIAPLTKALRRQGAPYRGLLYAGLMLTDEGPQVIEFNCRFGDPETQAILPVWEGDFAQTLFACARGKLNRTQTTSAPPNRCAVSVVLAAEGYPGSYRQDIPLEEIEDSERHVIFHAGTKRVSGRLYSTGGRVLNAVGIGSDIVKARENAYEAARRLQVQGLRLRSDIAGRF
ncbi:MAG: phosphoribosylamine--glycine ligase, partial [bacterium]|nr:phosphoribosylamine--glycine ligase [bacterium]